MKVDQFLNLAPSKLSDTLTTYSLVTSLYIQNNNSADYEVFNYINYQ